MTQYRIIYVDIGSDHCHWQLQKRKWIFFWENSCSNVLDATIAAHEMMRLMGK